MSITPSAAATNFARLLSELDVNFTDIEIKEMMDTFDKDGDGQINFEEYQAMRTLMDQRFVKFKN